MLFNIAIAQPLYAVLSHGTAFFVAHAFKPVQLVLFALSLSILIPAALASVPLLLRPLGERTFAIGRLSLVWALSLLALLPLLSPIDVSPVLPFAIAAAGASLFTLLYARVARLREFLRFASVVALIFPLAFLFFSPVRDLMGSAAAPDPQRPQVDLDIQDAPVFLVIFDEMATASLVDEQGAIDAKNFPNFARLAERTTWFRNATGNSTNTETAVPSILTGRHPQRDLAPNAQAHPVSLFTLLAPTYEMVAFESFVRLCPESICSNRKAPRMDPEAALRDLFVVYQHVVLPWQLREKLPQLDGRWSDFDEDGAAQPAGESRPKPAAGNPFGHKAKPHFEAFLASIDATAPGKFFFIHALVTHYPHVFLPDGRTYAEDSGHGNLLGFDAITNAWNQDPDLAARGYQRALLQTQMADGLLGQFLDRLEALGIEDEALIVVTSDHGANFIPGKSRRGFDRFVSMTDLWATGLMVPLFVKLPGQTRGERADRNVQSIDIAPTILDALGTAPADLFDGVSAIDVASAPPKSKQPPPYRGDRIELPADLIPFLLAAAHDKQALFRVSDGAADYYRLAHLGAAIGLPLDRFAIGPEEHATAALVAPISPPQPVPGVDFVAASVEGTIEGDVSALRSPFLAIARGGRVIAVAKRFDKDGKSRFHAILPPEFVGSQADATTFYSITEDEPNGGGMRLYPLPPRANAAGDGAR